MANAGGPAAALPHVDYVVDGLGPVLDHQNLLVVEPRGFGQSSPLSCAGIVVTKPETVRRCVDSLGTRAQFFTTDQAVRDHDAVRAALGVRAMTVFGNSYGTVLAQAYATRFASHTKAVYLDSTFLTDDAGFVSGWTAESSLRAGQADLDALCRASAPCRALAGDPKARLADVVARMRADGTNGADLFALSRQIGRLENPDIGRELNAAIGSYLAADPAPLRRLIDLMRARFPAELPPMGPEFAAYLGYVCGDGRYAFDRSSDPARRQAQLDAYYATETPFAPFTAAEGRGPFGQPYDPCVHWPTPRYSPPVAATERYPDVPVLVVGGQLDVNTPSDNGMAVARRFPHGTFIEHAYSSHAAWGDPDRRGGWCPRDLVRNFVSNPSEPPPSQGCQSATYQALARFPLLARDIPPAETPQLDPAQRSLLAATFATASDGSVRRQPATAGTPETMAGVRGGRLSFPENSSEITLDQVRYVHDVTVSGKINLASAQRATATLDVLDGTGGHHALTLAWPNLDASGRTPVTGTFDGITFVAQLPGF